MQRHFTKCILLIFSFFLVIGCHQKNDQTEKSPLHSHLKEAIKSSALEFSIKEDLSRLENKKLNIRLVVKDNVLKNSSTLESLAYKIRTTVKKEESIKDKFHLLNIFFQPIPDSEITNGRVAQFVIGINHILEPSRLLIDCKEAYHNFKGDRTKFKEVESYAQNMLIKTGLPVLIASCLYWDLHNMSAHPEDKINTLATLAMSYYQANLFQASLVLSQQVDILAENTGMPKYRSWALHNYGKTLKDMNQNYLAKEIFKESLEYSNKADLKQYGKTLHMLGIVEWKLGNSKQSRQYYRMSVEAKRESEEFYYLPQTLYMWIRQEFESKNYAEALKLIDELETFYESQPEKKADLEIGTFWEAKLLKAKILSDKGKMQESIEVLEHVVNGTNQDLAPLIHYHALLGLVAIYRTIDIKLYNQYKIKAKNFKNLMISLSQKNAPK